MFTGMPDFHQSVELMKNMWANAAKGTSESGNFGMPGLAGMNPFGIPTLDIEEIEKRIKDLKSVEAWLTLNLNVLQSTIQGLEVQKATLSALQGIAETMKNTTGATTDTKNSSTNETPNMADFAGSSGKLASDLMEQMSKSMTNMMANFPSTMKVKPSATAAAKKTPRKTPATSVKKTAAKTTPNQKTTSRG